MQIAAKTVASFHYTLHDELGEQLESSAGAPASAYLHGYNNILKGLEAAMSGKSAGDKFTVTLQPADAYGVRIADRQQRVPIKHLSHQGKLRPGAVAQLNTDQGRQSVTVIKVGRHSADIDANHPLAGQTLRFEISIVDVRAATPEELTHGHAHGAGGHHH